MEADVPLSEAWALWSNQENVVNWMPWIASVKVSSSLSNGLIYLLFNCGSIACVGRRRFSFLFSFSELGPGMGCYIQVLDDKPNMSKWTLRYSAFGQNFEFSWLARNLKVYTPLIGLLPRNLLGYMSI